MWLYLHYVFDLWTQAWRQKMVRGDLMVVRFADDIVVEFPEEGGSRAVLGGAESENAEIPTGAAPGEDAVAGVWSLCDPRPAAAWLCGKTKKRRFAVVRQTIRKRLLAKFQEGKPIWKRRMHTPIAEMGQWLRAVAGRHFRYHGVRGGESNLDSYRDRVVDFI